MKSLTKDQQQYLSAQITDYLSEELSIDIGEFDAQFLCDFIAQQFGPHFYNQGLEDAQVKVAQRVDLITEAIDELIQPLDG